MKEKEIKPFINDDLESSDDDDSGEEKNSEESIMTF